MSIPNQLASLVGLDKLREVVGLGRPAFIHEDHRWVLPILAWAQSEGFLRRPALLVMFDYHTDFARPLLVDSEEGRISSASFNKAPDLKLLMEICGQHPDKNDGDWVSGGMELGIIGDAIVLGAETGEGEDEREGRCYKDLLGRQHMFFPLPLPHESLTHQGALADHYHKPQGLWEALGWTKR